MRVDHDFLRMVAVAVSLCGSPFATAQAYAQELPSVAVGESIDASLDESDMDEYGEVARCYLLAVPAAARLKLQAESLAYPVEVHFGPETSDGCSALAELPFSAFGTPDGEPAELIVPVEAGQRYIVRVEARYDYGPFTLNIADVTAAYPLTVAGEPTPLEAGMPVRGVLAKDDPIDDSGDYYDCYALPVEAGTIVKIQVTSETGVYISGGMDTGTGCYGGWVAQAYGLPTIGSAPIDGLYLIMVTALGSGTGDLGPYEMLVTVARSEPGAIPELAAGEVVLGRLEEGDTTGPEGEFLDCYLLDGSAGEERMVATGGSETSLVLEFGPAGSDCATAELPQSAGDGYSSNLRLLATFAEDGRHFVRVRGSTGYFNSGAYSIALIDQGPGTSVGSIAIGDTRTGVIDATDHATGSFDSHAECYRLDGHAGEWIAISNGTPLLHNIDFGPEAVGFECGTTDLVETRFGGDGPLVAPILEDGPHIIRIESVSTGEYELSVRAVEPGTAAEPRILPIVSGDVLEGALTPGGEPAQCYVFLADAAGLLSIESASAEFDLRLEFGADEGKGCSEAVLTSLSEAGDLSSEIEATLQIPVEPGSYLVRVSSVPSSLSNETGAYTLALSLITTVAGAPIQEVKVGETLTGHLEPTDLQNFDGGFQDCYLFSAEPGQWLRIDAVSSGVDTTIAFGPGDEAAACGEFLYDTNADGGTGRNARLLATPDREGSYLVRVSGGRGETGAYELTVSDAKAAPVEPVEPFEPIQDIEAELTIGDSIEGELLDTDMRNQFDQLTKCYVMIGPPGTPIEISVSSISDTEVEIGPDNGGRCANAVLTAADDDGGDREDARLFATVGPQGREIIRVSHAQYTSLEGGSFTLSVSEMVGPPVVAEGFDAYDFDGVPFQERAMSQAELWRFQNLLAAASDANMNFQWPRFAAIQEQLIELASATLGPAHPQTLNEQVLLGAAWARLGRHADGRALHENILPAFEAALGPYSEPVRNLKIELASELAALGSYAAAETLLRDLLVALSPGGDEYYGVIAELAESLERQGRFTEAHAFREEMVRVADITSGGDPAASMIAMSFLARNLGLQGKIDEAGAVLNRVVVAAHDLVEQVQAMPNVSDLDDLFYFDNLGSVFFDSALYAEAEPFLRLTADGYARVFGADNPGALETLRKLAASLDALGRYDDAEADHLAAIAGMEVSLGDMHPDTARAYYGYALNLIARDRADEAAELLRRAIAAQTQSLGASHPETLQSLETLSRLQLEAGASAQALTHARLALKGRAEAQVRESAFAPDHKRAPFAAATGAAASMLVESAYAEAQQDPMATDALLREAFLAAQQIRSGDAATAFARSAALLAAGRAGVEADARRWVEVLGERQAIDRQFAESFDPALPDGRTIRDNLAFRRTELDAEIETLSRALEAQAPDFFALVSPAPVSVAELTGVGGAGILGENEALVVLTQSEDERSGFVFVVSRRGRAWAPIDLTAEELRAAIGSLREGLNPGTAQTRAAVALIGEVGVFDRTASHLLYRALFGAPEVDALLADADRVLLAPQGDLISLPFAVLVTAPPTGDDNDPQALRDTSWLGLEKQLSIVPAVSTLATQRSLSADASDGRRVLFAMADPAFTGAAGADRAPGDASLVADGQGNLDSIRLLPKLPGTRTELMAVVAALGAEESDYFLDTMANETRLVEASESGRLRDSRVVLFGTHGLLGIEAGFSWLGEPALALSPPDGAAPLPIEGLVNDPDRLDDGLLTATEAARLTISADWVILSACNTASGGTPSAEGLSGLARGFLYAGARSLLVSHWPVSDTVGARLVSETVRLASAGEGYGRAGALRAAMAAVAADRSQDATGRSLAHPAFWAPFAVVGVDP